MSFLRAAALPLLLVRLLAAQQTPAAFLPLGPSPVGFSRLAIGDSAGPAPFTAGVWYPARAGATEHLTYRRYILVDGREEEVAGLAGLLASRGAPPEAVTRWLDEPVLHLYERLDSIVRPDFGLLRSLGSAERWLVEVPELHHHLFTSLGAAGLRHPELRAALGGSAGAARGYAAAAGATLNFLDAYVRDRADARARLGAECPWPDLGAPTIVRRGGR